MRHECKITVIDKKCFTEFQEQYLADPKSGPCPFYNVGDTFLLKRTPEQDDFYHLMNGKFCGEAWDAVSRYVYTALQGGSIMKGWTNDDRMMIACCNDGTRPVIFKIGCIDIPEICYSQEAQCGPIFDQGDRTDIRRVAPVFRRWNSNGRIIRGRIHFFA